MTAPSNSLGRARAIVYVLFSLASTTAVPQRSDLLSRLEAAEQRWKPAALDNYAYTFTFRASYVYVDCEGDSFRTRIVNGAPENLPGCDRLRSAYATVPHLFAFVREALDAKPDSIEVSFDPELGFPVSVAIDYGKRTSDDEIYFDVSSFVRDGE